MGGKNWFRGSMILSLAVKAGSVLTGFLTARAVLRWFGNPEVQGIWYTLTSVLLLLLNFDLGLGNGLRQQMTREFAQKDWKSAEKTLSTGIVSYAVITVLLAPVGCQVARGLDWGRVFGGVVSSEGLALSVMFLFVGVLLRFFLLSVAAVLNALQMTAINNLLALCASVLQLLLLIRLHPRNAEQGLVWLSAGSVLTMNLPAAAAGLILWHTGKSVCRPTLHKADWRCLKNLFGVGISFFVCQIAYMVLMNTNEMLISACFGPQYTTEYTYYYKLATLSAMAAVPVLVPVWSAVAGAMAKGDRLWVHNMYRRLKQIGILAVLGQLVFVGIQQPVMNFWLGAFPVDNGTALVFAFFGGAFTYGMILSTLVSGLGRLKIQMVCYCAGAVVKLLAVPHMSHWRQIVLCNAVVLGIYCVWQQWELDRYFRPSNGGSTD